MRPSFHPRLVNPPFEDPALFVPFFFEKRALLFDMGDLHRLPAREILKLTHGFATHTHMDHFTGFDTLLRTFLGRDSTLHVFGPPRLLQNIEGKLAGYTWNLVENYTNGFSIKATEVHPGHTITRTYDCESMFKSRSDDLQGNFEGILVNEPAFSVEAIHLNHDIPCLAFNLKERFHVNIIKDGLDRLKIPVGPWLGEFKKALYKEQDPDEEFHIQWKDRGAGRSASFRLGDLSKRIALISSGQKITYIVDVVYDNENAAKIVEFAHEADHLFIEAAFLHADVDIARRKYHLTARQAGTLAREARVKQFTIFHFSPRYTDAAHLLQQEAQQAFLEGARTA